MDIFLGTSCIGVLLTSITLREEILAETKFDGLVPKSYAFWSKFQRKVLEPG